MNLAFHLPAVSLAPLLQASPIIQIHVAAALAAFTLGIIQFVAPKGTLPHRTLGWIWVTLMAIAALSSFRIHHIKTWGNFSPIHLLSIFVLAQLTLAIVAVRRHRVSAHKKGMMGLFVGGLIIAGGFAFLPGRVMHAVLMGG